MNQEITVGGVKYHRKDEYDALMENYFRALDRETRMRETISELEALRDCDTKLIESSAEALLNMRAKNRVLQNVVDAALPILDWAVGQMKQF